MKAQYRLFDKLFNIPNPESGDFHENINMNSLEIKNGYVEAFMKEAELGESYQLLRKGYFTLDNDSEKGNLVFNRVVSLKDSFNKKR